MFLKPRFNYQRKRVIVFHNGELCVNQQAYVDIDEDSGTSDTVFTTLTLKSNLTIGSKDPHDDDLLYGELTDFYVWKKSLTLDEARRFTQNCNHPIVETGLLIQWRSERIIER